MLLQLIGLFLRGIKPRKVKFYQWTILENLAAEIRQAVETDITKFPKLVMDFVSTALRIPQKLLGNIPWWGLLFLYQLAQEVNVPTKIPLLISQEKKSPHDLGWDYPGRDWHYWSHLLSKEYGWDLEYVKKLDVDVALAHIQEILTDVQLDKEFLWSMSEIAYPYNKTTKESKFSPLPRPYFMQASAPKPKKLRMLKILAPVGEIHDASGMEKYFQEEIQTETT